MKKLIAILTIMIVLVGAVFAATPTGNAAILVTSSIEPVEPTFKMYTAQVSVELANQTAEQARTAALAGSAHVITANALLENNQAVVFTVQQLTNSRSVKTYTLSAAATDLVLYKYQDANGDDVLVSETPHPATDAEKKFTVDATTVNTFANGSLTSAQATYGGTAIEKTITYKGTFIDTTSDGKAPIDVASFTCTWGANPIAVTGDYRATVTLTISST